MSVEVESWLRTEPGEFRRIEAVERYDGDEHHVPGAVVLRLDGVEVLDQELWDDIDWLWPFIIQAADECRATGSGERYFPDQPLLFRIERLAGWAGRLLVSIRGDQVARSATASATEFYPAVAAAAMAFFQHLDRLVPGSIGVDAPDIERIRSWAVLPP